MTTTKTKTKTKRKPADKRRLNELLVKRARPKSQTYLIWDSKQTGLALRVRPSSARSWYYVYSRHNRSRWLHLGDANVIALSDARQLAGEAALAVARGKDPAAEKRAERSRGTFAELADSYREQHAKKHNKSLAAGQCLGAGAISIPRWGPLQASRDHAQRRQGR